MKGILIPLFILLFSISSIIAHDEEDFSKAEDLIKQRAPCNALSEEQLELIGDYYMEQMHPGELHEVMDERMGGEGSLTLKQTHINIARSFYCGEHGYMSVGMMNVMMGRSGMMGANNYHQTTSQQDFFGNTIIAYILGSLIAIIFILLIILLIKQLNKPQRKNKK